MKKPAANTTVGSAVLAGLQQQLQKLREAQEKLAREVDALAAAVERLAAYDGVLSAVERLRLPVGEKESEKAALLQPPQMTISTGDSSLVDEELSLEDEDNL